MLRTRRPNRKGQALLEYAFLIAGIAFIALVAVSVFGHKLSDQYAIAAGMLACAHADDAVPIAAMQFVETTDAGPNGSLVGTGVVDGWQDITGVTGTGEMENNVAAQGGAPATAEMFVAEP